MRYSLWNLLYIFVLLKQKPTCIYSLPQNVSKKHGIIFKVEDEMVLKSGSVCYETSTSPIIKLINFIAEHYLPGCVTVILYDEFFYQSLSFQPVIAQLLKVFPGPLIHGQFTTEELASNKLARTLLDQPETLCRNYILLTQTLDPVAELLGPQTQSKVVLIPQSSQWQINSFLESQLSNQLVNLLIIVDPLLQLDMFSKRDETKLDINMYTHELYATPMGTSVPRVVAAWRCGQLTRPGTNLFPTKITSLGGYQLRVVAAEQPPYLYKRDQLDKAGDSESHWDGLEVRLIKLVANHLNFTIKFQPPTRRLESTEKSVLADLTDRRADICAAGVYITLEMLRHYQISFIHSHDCAVFMTLASTALPKYRAIMGPFRWEVWMTITLAYLLAILPISFSVHHSLRILLHSPYEIENMFWYVFGTFTNCFTFTGKKSWSSGKMASTRMFIGTYWAFSIIISAAYSGSIIAFIMLPVFPEVMETPQQLVEEDYKLAVTNNSHLTETVLNSSDATIQQLAKELKVVDSVDEGVRNVTERKFFTQYAFLHPREFLKHVIRTKYTLKSSKQKFHLSQNCFVPMLVSLMFPKGSVLVDTFNGLLMKASQGGFVDKLVVDVAWDQQRSGTGKLLQVTGGGKGLKTQPPEDKQLTLDDTQGMFLLMGAGFAIAFVAFISECCVFWWHKRFTHFNNKLPSIAYPEQDKSNESNLNILCGRDAYWQYFGSSTHHSLFQSNAMVHAERSPKHNNMISQSLSVLQLKYCENKKRSPSV